MFDNSFPAYAGFFGFLFFCFVFSSVEIISSRTLIPLFSPGSVHSGSASWNDCDRAFPDELRLSSFLDMFPHSVWTAAQLAHSDFVGSKCMRI